MVDLSYLRSISDNQQTFINQMIQSFLDLAPVYIDDMKKAIEQENYQDLALSTHKLKPSATYMGIENLLQVMEQIEELVKQAAPPKDQIQGLIKEVEERCTQSYPLLQQELKQ